MENFYDRIDFSKIDVFSDHTVALLFRDIETGFLVIFSSTGM